MYASYSPEQLGSAWVLSHLGMHPAGETKNLFDKVCARYKTHLHENYIYIAWPLRQLGNLYGLLGNYPKAKFILEQVLVIYQKNYGKNHLTAAFALSDLGHIYLLEGQLEISENLIRKALMILENNKHPDAYKCLEDLSELYIKKYRLAKAKGDPASANTVYSKAIASLIQAVDIVKIHLPNSAHEKRIREKFEKIQ